MRKHYLMIALACSIIASCSKNDSTNNPTPNNNNGNNTNPTTQAFLLYRVKNTQNELWSVNGDGSNNHKINIALPTGWILEDEDMAEISKDGSYIVFLAHNGTDGIFKCNIDGSNVTQIYSEPNVSLGIQDVVSNSMVLYVKHVTKGLDLYITNQDGSNNHKINISLPTNSFLSEEELAKVSNDGQYIYFLGQDTVANKTTIYKSTITGSNVTAINTENVNISLAIQCVANNKMYYRKRDLSGNVNELWSVNTDGSGKQQINLPLSNMTLQNEEMAKVSADGNSIYFTAKNTAQSILRFNIEETNATTVYQGTGNDIAIQSLK